MGVEVADELVVAGVAGARSCDRFNFLDGGEAEDGMVEGGEARAAAREACVTGRWMPSEGRESDLRRVL